MKMNWKNIKLIFTKELIGTVRDKRTIIAMVIIPLIFYPLLFMGIGYFGKMGNIKSEEAASKIIISGTEFAPQLVEYFQDNKKIEVHSTIGDSQSNLQKGEVQAILIIPQDFEYKIESGESGQLILKYDATEAKSSIAQKRINQIIEEYKK